MAGGTLKILQQMMQDFQSLPDHSGTRLIQRFQDLITSYKNQKVES